MFSAFAFAAPNDFELSEAAKAAYRAENWPAFFGLARYIERHAAELPSAGRVRALEALALLRHCRWSEAARIVEETKGSIPADLREPYAALAQFLKMQPTLPEQPAPIEPPAFSRRRFMWAAPPVEKNPFAWRVVVESHCPEVRR